MVIVGVGLLIATFFPPVIVALLNRGTFGASTKPYSPKSTYVWHSKNDNGMGGWRPYKKHVPKSPPTDFDCNTDQESQRENLIDNWFRHFFDILIYCLHHRESNRY
uniref:Uncharacterized protein n=1 Tax=Theileria annulata TaxID=5874 RepID=A0A3B0MH23_THEAN